MKTSQLFFPTLREEPRDAELVSHKLLVRGGFVKSVAAGVYSYLPLGWRVHEKISQIVREEVNSFGGQEIHMPVLVPKELLDESGRSSVPVLFALKDKNDRDFFLGFTHEEVVTDICRSTVSSWKQMPLYLYQIQTKERDEPRPRGGLIRGREFTMFDGYSFDANEDHLELIYRENYRAYERVFRRCGLDYLAVEADPGAIGGSENHEFMILTESGEDTVLRCDSCGYAANAERAEIPALGVSDTSVKLESSIVDTPGAHTIDEVSAFLKVDANKLIKTIVSVNPDGTVFAALVRGDRDLNLPKLSRAVGQGALELADAGTVVRVTGAPVGFAGPVDLAENVAIFADNELMHGGNYVVGANVANAHRINVTPGSNFKVDQWADIRTAVAGDTCPRCPDGVLTDARGIEVGHIFKLGTKYSKAMNALFQNDRGEKNPVLMGCYGLGVSRTMAAAIEAHNDKNGIAWPISIAPFEVAIIIANTKDPVQLDAGKSIYRALKQKGVDVLLEDREERPGVKFKDMDLIGIPIQTVIGKGLADGVIEVGLRGVEGGRTSVPLDIAIEHIFSVVQSERSKVAL